MYIAKVHTVLHHTIALGNAGTQIPAFLKKCRKFIKKMLEIKSRHLT